jgi:hypothetical protein
MNGSQATCEKQNFEIDSPKTNGGHKNYILSWPPLEAALSISNFNRFLSTTVFVKDLITVTEITFSAE